MPLLHILLCSSLDTPPEPSPLFDVRVHASRRRTSPLVLTHPSLSARSRARFRHPLPFHALTPSRARAQCHRRRPRRPNSLPCLDSSRYKPLHLALHLLRSTPSPIALFPGRNRSRRCVLHCCSTPKLYLAVELPSPTSLRPIEGHRELPHVLHHLPDLFPFELMRHHRREHVAPPRLPRRRRPLVARLPVMASCAKAARTGAACLRWHHPRPASRPPRFPVTGTRHAAASALHRRRPPRGRPCSASVPNHPRARAAALLLCAARWPAGLRPPRARRARRRRAWPGAEQSRAPPLSLDSNGSWGPLVRVFVFIFFVDLS